RYGWTPRGELAAVYDRSNTQVRSFTYDDKYRGRMVAHRHTGRPEIRYRYDSDGRVTEQLNPAGLSYTYQYEKDHITITDSLDRREVLHTQGEAGLKRVVKKEHADGSVTQSQFDAVGRLRTQTDAAGRTTEYSPDVVTGLITRITTPDGRASAFYYNHHNQLTSATGPDGLELRREYDELGRLIQETAPDGDITRYRYDNPHSDLPCATEDATGSRKTMTWSRYGQLLSFTDCSGYVTRYDHDRFGQMTAVHREEGLSQYRAYDSRGQLIAVKDTQGHETRYEYNIAGDLTAVIAPDGSRNGTQYDAWGKAVRTTQGGLTRSMEYDAAGRVIRLTSENGSHTTFRYDVLDRLIQETGFDGRTQRYHHDLTGKLIRSEDEGLVTHWHYDEADRLTHRTVKGETAERWQYDERGWLTDISHISEGHRVAVHYRYDEKGRLQQLIRLPGQQYDEESGLYYNRHRYYDPLQGRYITQDPIGLKGGWNFYQYPLNPVQYIDSMGLASKYGHLNNGGYGARPNKPPTPDPSKLPDIAKQLRLPYPIDQASSAPNVFKTFFRALSPYDYTLYCRKWVKPNLTCTPQDDSQYPGMDTKTASDYLPQTNWPTTQLPPGYTCAEPYLFPDINKPDGPATAGIDDLGEILAKMKQRTSRGIRK
ncbi:RHS repeat-associated core domain-containing protein, partial [Escherichia coli]|nr:RHS repeat-associated core domain-containing protein [Escherichia coli]